MPVTEYEIASHVSTIFDIIVPHVTRWRKLEVFVDEDVFMDNVLTRLAQCTSAPLLEILALHYFGYQRRKWSLIPFHGNTPRLSHMSLENVIIGWLSSDLENEERVMRSSWVDFPKSHGF
jgi:hypothetical protein